MKPLYSIALALGLTGAALGLNAGAAFAADDTAIARGKYMYDAADCAGCHGGDINGGPPAGGRSFPTPFGTFRAPNISSDAEHGIGRWSDEQFRTAVRHGTAPGGKQLFPVFPYTSFTGLTDQDINDIHTYIMSLPAAPDASKPHDIKFPFGFRPVMYFWKALFFKPGPITPVAGQSDEWNRGNYLVHAVAHCEECHTPRSKLTGVVDHSKAFSGNIGGPDGQNAPNITSDVTSGLGDWSVDDFVHLLKTGETPDFDSVASGMAAVIRSTKKMTDEDRHAMAVYLKSIPPIHTVKPPPPPASSKS